MAQQDPQVNPSSKGPKRRDIPGLNPDQEKNLNYDDKTSIDEESRNLAGTDNDDIERSDFSEQDEAYFDQLDGTRQQNVESDSLRKMED